MPDSTSLRRAVGEFGRRHQWLDAPSNSTRADAKIPISGSTEDPKASAEAAFALLLATGSVKLASGMTSDDVVLFERGQIRSGRQTVTLTASREPRFAGIDPYNKRIDRNSKDNVIAIDAAVNRGG